MSAASRLIGTKRAFFLVGGNDMAITHERAEEIRTRKAKPYAAKITGKDPLEVKAEDISDAVLRMLQYTIDEPRL